MRSLLHRLRWTRDDVVASIETTQPAVVARSFVYLFGLGATLTLVVPALDGGRLKWPWGLYGAAGAAYLVAIVVLVVYEEMPSWAVRSLPPIGTVLVTLVVLSAPAADVQVYALLYFWVVLSACSFYGLPSSLIDLALVAVGYAIAVVVRGEDNGLALWLMTVATLTVTGVLLALLRARADTLILSLDAASRTDALTGLLNRRGFETLLGDELDRCRRNKRTCSLVVFDLDGFKAVNDRWGHPTGDALLKVFAGILRDGRTTDRVGRLGGDEFALLLPETDSAGAAISAGRMIGALDEAHGLDVDVGRALRASAGISCFPADGQDESTLHDAADLALYRAKQQGGGRAVGFEASMRALTS